MQAEQFIIDAGLKQNLIHILRHVEPPKGLTFAQYESFIVQLHNLPPLENDRNADGEQLSADDQPK